MKFKMKKNYLMMICIILLTVIISGCANSETARIELSQDSFDLGDINPDDGIRTEIFFVKNTGVLPLKITSIGTSCGCTEAEVESDEILPGEQTQLTVTYDPSVHPGLTGKINRVVYIKSNDPFNEEIELNLVGNSLPSSKPSEEHEEPEEHDEEYEGLLKDFEISPPALYDKIKDGDSFKLLDVREDFEYEENHIKDTLLLSVNKISQDELDNLGLNKDDEIVLYCRSGKRSAKAYEILKSLGYTNVKSLYGGMVHWEEDEYPVEQGSVQTTSTSEETTKGTPSISFDRTEQDFGEITQFGGVVKTIFNVQNMGDADLKISSISTSCGCASAELDELVIPAGESSHLTVSFDPDFHEEPAGKFSRTVFLETNDPSNPEAEVKIWVDILEGE